MPKALQDWIKPAFLQSTVPYSKQALEECVVCDNVFMPERLARIEEFMRAAAAYKEPYRSYDKTDKLSDHNDLSQSRMTTHACWAKAMIISRCPKH